MISNVTADEVFEKDVLKKLLIDQIESRVRWRESVIKMIDKGMPKLWDNSKIILWECWASYNKVWK